MLSLFSSMGRPSSMCAENHHWSPNFISCINSLHEIWIGNGAVLKSSSQLQLNKFWKLNNFGHELFIFKILLTTIDWNF